ncbi:MAG: hypothetical protein AB8B55_17725 [Mariniblastus sp.]
MNNHEKLKIIQHRIEQLGLHCPTPPITHAISAPVYALLCMPMYQVAVTLALKTDEESEESVIEDLFGVKNVREALALGNEVADVPVSECDAVVLRKLLVFRRPIDSIIYDHAMDTIGLFFEVANDDVIEFAKLIVARTITSIAQASGNGWLGMGAEPSPEQHLAIKSISERLKLKTSPSASAVLD